jgi:PhnB protein
MIRAARSTTPRSKSAIPGSCWPTSPDIQALSPKTIGGSPVSLHLYVEDVDASVERAVAAGAKLIRPAADQFYGDRVGWIEDPFGYRWFIATHKEDLTTDEIRRRAAAQAR